MAAKLFDSGPDSFEYQLWTNADGTTRDGVLDLAQSHSSRPYFRLHMVLRHCDVSPLDLFEKYGHHLAGISVKRSDAEPGAGVVRLRLADKSAETFLGCAPAGIPSAWLLFTTARTRTPENDRLVEPLLARLSSRIVPGWLSSHELEKVMLEFEAQVGGRILPSRVASRGYDRSTVEYRRAGKMSDVIADLRDNELLMHSLEFKLTTPDGKRPLLSGALNRSFRVSYKKGQTRLLKDYLLAKLLLRFDTHFNRVAVRENDRAASRSIVYRFEQESLMSGESHQRLVNSLAGVSHFSVCAFHMNPYLNVSVTDLLDGSSMSLVSDSTDEMYVMPGRKCTSGAVSRVLDAVFERFAAGKVERSDALAEDWATLLDACS